MHLTYTKFRYYGKMVMTFSTREEQLLALLYIYKFKNEFSRFNNFWIY